MPLHDISAPRCVSAGEGSFSFQDESRNAGNAAPGNENRSGQRDLAARALSFCWLQSESQLYAELDVSTRISAAYRSVCCIGSRHVWISKIRDVQNVKHVCLNAKV